MRTSTRSGRTAGSRASARTPARRGKGARPKRIAAGCFDPAAEGMPREKLAAL